MPDHPRTPLPPRTLGEAVIARWRDTDAIATPSTPDIDDTPDLFAPCCRSAEVDARLTSLSDPANHPSTDEIGRSGDGPQPGHPTDFVIPSFCSDDEPTGNPRDSWPGWTEARYGACHGDPATTGHPTALPVTLDDGATLPARAHPTDAGLDLFSIHPVEKILPGQIREVRTGVHVAIPTGYYGRIEGRSGLARKGIVPAGGCIDRGFTGEIVVVLANVGLNHVTPEAGKAVAQLVLCPCLLATPVVVGDLGETARGENGFGSTDGI